MKRRYKILISLGALLLLVFGLGFYLLSDEDRQRALLIKAIEASIGGTIEIEGEVTFSVGEISSFAAERLTFALPDADTSGTIGRLRVSIDTRSVVDGPLIIEELLVERGDILVASGPDVADAANGNAVTFPLIKRIEIVNTQLDVPIPSPDDRSTITADELTLLQRGDAIFGAENQRSRTCGSARETR